MKEETFEEIRTKIRRKIAEGELEQAISILIQYIKESPDQKLNNRVHLASFDFKQTRRQDMHGVISKELFLSHQKEIAHEVLAILDDVENGNYESVIRKLTKLGLLLGISLLVSGDATHKFSSFTDPRDGQTYKTIKLIGKNWMAENLSYDVGEECCFYRHDLDNGKKYGRLYTWDAAMRACPSDWRLPTAEEWKKLAREFGGYYGTVAIGNPEQSYSALIQGGSSGFSAQLGGSGPFDGKFNSLSSLDYLGYYWSATEMQLDEVWCFKFDRRYGMLFSINASNTRRFSCRCLQD